MKKIFLLLTVTYLLLAIPSLALAATLSLSPATGTFNRGCNFSLNVELNTAGVQTDGTDAILKYDISRLNATSITSGTIYPDYPGNNIDAQNGKITISGLASVAQAFSGSGTLGTINFTVSPQAPTGATLITFDFDPNDKAKTIDSNVVERGTIAEVLSAVTNGSYTIGTGTCGAQTQTIGTTPTQGAGGTGVAATPSAGLQKTLPPAGGEQLTFTVAILGTVLTVLGLLGLILL
ncbi:hypothetical protein HY387_00725 [Candidatus Daviesbacteria bacterium]|nr:hypothetical protein [Candidatus Daviesbacteria bacterium]